MTYKKEIVAFCVNSDFICLSCWTRGHRHDGMAEDLEFTVDDLKKLNEESRAFCDVCGREIIPARQYFSPGAFPKELIDKVMSGDVKPLFDEKKKDEDEDIVAYKICGDLICPSCFEGGNPQALTKDDIMGREELEKISERSKVYCTVCGKDLTAS